MPVEKGSENHGNHAHPWDSTAWPGSARGDLTTGAGGTGIEETGSLAVTAFQRR